MNSRVRYLKNDFAQKALETSAKSQNVVQVQIHANSFFRKNF